MRRYILILLTVLTLFTQWGWLEHAYHDHDVDDSCEFCLFGHAYDQSITPNSLSLPTEPFRYGIAADRQEELPAQTTNHYTIRAPPLLSHRQS